MTNGTTEYTKATVEIFFEKDHVACAYCPMLTETPRFQCRRTGEYLSETKHVVGRWCPLLFNDEGTIH